MNHIDLFSGIGGFARAAREVWGSNYHNAFFCEINKFCCAVIRKNFGKDCFIYEDIKTVTKTRYAADILSRNTRQGDVSAQGSGQCPLEGGETESPGADCRHGHSVLVSSIKHKDIRGNENEIKEQIVTDTTILTAGVPCQPASCAGKRKGTSDTRWLWPETFRVIREFKPTWCLLENVYGLLSLERGLVFESLCAELETIGYEVQPLVIPACGVNAPHRRYRVWIVAKSTSEGQQELKRPHNGTNETQIKTRMGIGFERVCVLASNPQTAKLKWASNTRSRRIGFADESETTSDNKGLQRYRQDGECAGKQSFRKSDWEKDWREVAIATCNVRVDDGVSVRLDSLNLTAAGHRAERLKALGNSVCVPLVVEIMKSIKYVDNS